MTYEVDFIDADSIILDTTQVEAESLKELLTKLSGMVYPDGTLTVSMQVVEM